MYRLSIIIILGVLQVSNGANVDGSGFKIEKLVEKNCTLPTSNEETLVVHYVVSRRQLYNLHNLAWIVDVVDI